jgi:hypothetical protein
MANKFRWDRDGQRFILTALSFLGVISTLIYTFVHTGSVLARYVHPAQIGYLAAFGIELMILVVSWQIGTQLRARKRNWFMISVLAIALFVSAIANVYEGYHVRFGRTLTWQTINTVDPLEALVGLASTALLPLMVFAMAEVIGSDVRSLAKLAENWNQPEPGTVKPKPIPADSPNIPNSPNETNGNGRMNGANRISSGDDSYKQQVFALLDEFAGQGKPLPGATFIGQQVGCNKSTAHKWATAWGEQSGNGYRPGKT